MKITAAILVALALSGGLFGAASVTRTAPVAQRQEHGGFTGDIKSVLYVADVESSAAFFEKTLGFEALGFAERADGTPYYAELAAGGRKFGLHEPVNADQEGRIGKQRIYFRVRDLDAHRRRLQAWGVDTGQTHLTDWMDYFIVRDGDGHEIVFAVTDPERHATDPW